MNILTKVLPMLPLMKAVFVAGLAVGATIGVCVGVGGTVAVVMITKNNEKANAQRDESRSDESDS